MQMWCDSHVWDFLSKMCTFTHRLDIKINILSFLFLSFCFNGWMIFFKWYYIYYMYVYMHLACYFFLVDLLVDLFTERL